MGSGITKRIIFVCVLCLTWLRTGKGDTEFDNDHSKIWFEPYVNYGHFANINSLDVASVMKMVAVIATKFGEIFVNTISWETIGQAESLIPKAVATYNKHYRNNSADSPVKLHVHFSFVKGKNPENGEVLLGIVKDLADEANKIFPKTVVSLILDYSDDEQCQDLVEGFEFVSEKLMPTSYQLGIRVTPTQLVDISKCSHNESSKLPLFHLNFVIVNQAYYDNEHRRPKTLLPATLTVYENAKRSIQIIANRTGFRWTPNFMLLTGYSSNNVHLVEFWKLFNDWSIKANDTVIFYQAFDQLPRTAVESYSGWWRLNRDKPKEYNNPSEYEYEEKEQVIGKESEIEPAHWLEGEIAIALVFTGIIVMLFTLVSWVCFYLRVKKRLLSGPLTKEERSKFFDGSATTSTLNGNSMHLNIMDHLQYNRNFEMAKENITIYEDRVLGRGNFGLVCVAKVVLDGEDQQVALKMTSECCSIQGLKGLLSEIKVLSYIGDHDNITKLVGAYTAEIEKGKVFVLTELCEGGSLEKYLRSLEHSDYTDTCGYLFRWSCEIANAMEFLTTKRVVHADLATRNVLLTYDMHAKICDFGLSRRLYNLVGYEKGDKKNAQVPWRWTAPEALRGLVFSEKTDVWSYGITLWEIYTLGDLPYLNIYSSDQLLEFLDGHQTLAKPLKSSEDVYSEVMLRCWKLESANRPTFKNLKQILKNINSERKSPTL